MSVNEKLIVNLRKTFKVTDFYFNSYVGKSLLM